MRRVTRDASFRFQRRVFINERTLFVGVTLNAGGVGANSETRLLQFKTSVRIVTVAALHRTFENFVVERHVERGLYLTVTTGTELWLPAPEHVD